MKAFFILFLFYSLYSFADTEDCLQSVSSTVHDYWPDTENTSDVPRVYRVKEIILHHLEKKQIAYTNHALKRMEERSISKNNVKRVLKQGIHNAGEDTFDRDNNDWVYFITHNAEDSPQSEKPLRIAVSLRPIQTNEPKIVVVSVMDQIPPPSPQENVRKQYQYPVPPTIHYWPDTENTSGIPRVLHIKEIILYHLERGNIAYTNNADKRMKEQFISEDDVRQALREGVHVVKKDFFHTVNNDWLYSITANVKGSSPSKRPLKIIVSLRQIHTDEPKIVVTTAMIKLPDPPPPRKPGLNRKIKEKHQQHRQKNFRKKITHYDEDYDYNE